MTTQRIGDYLLREPVASDGPTVTYRAERSAGPGDAEPSEAEPSASRAPAPRSVLLETVKPGLDPTAMVRNLLRREAELLARLAHPLFPTLLDARLAGEQPMLVLDDLGGARLDAVLARVERLELGPALAIAVELSRALAHMHREGLVHGRLRPEQVELGRSGAVRLCSLGMARVLDSAAGAEGDELSLLPEDMAPEQIVGETESARTDVFLLGLLLYRMLTGGKAYPRGSDGASSHQSRQAGVPKLRRHAPNAPPGLERVLERCLARRPRDRYADLDSLASQLLRLLHAETSALPEHLVCRALARADLGKELPLPAETRPGLGRGLLRALPGWFAAGIGVGLAAALGLGLALRAVGGAAPDGGSGVRGVEQRAAELRVLAQPWAEIYLDGELVDVTPIGRPIPLSPGRHEVRFTHPNSPDQVRTVDVIAGQSLWLDVTMPVVRPAPGASASAEPGAEQAP
jgi:hypothetical protein